MEQFNTSFQQGGHCKHRILCWVCWVWYGTCISRVFWFKIIAGPGGNNIARVPVEDILDSADTENLTVEGVFLEKAKWIDYENLY
ncbi:hypothetical protein BDN67DRAFT_964632 [Paxillus ammoniavirescens]|nr:hypothetical protein BDN67DRAFT_964632 [Paxillus ammoniavirescens]